jgi:cellulose synthase/poly-beta-1,6-N-acetylglucosamine synthase-like glycosyltransferase
MTTIFWIFLTSLILLLIGYPSYLSLLLLLGNSEYMKPNEKDSSFPYVSILIPAYNEATGIRNKIMNTLNIKYSPNRFEIIIINDCSSDKTKDIVLEYARDDPRLTLLDQKERKGKPSALNLALSHAKGDIIVVSDADCLLQRDCVRQ